MLKTRMWVLLILAVAVATPLSLLAQDSSCTPCPGPAPGCTVLPVPGCGLHTPGCWCELGDDTGASCGKFFRGCSKPPRNADEETAACDGCSVAGQPINLANGNTYITQTDVRIPGLGGGLMLTRTWNSKWPFTQNAFKTGMFGMNWRATYEERVFADDVYIKYLRDDGSFWSFSFNGNGWQLVAPANGGVKLTGNGNYWTVTFPNGEMRRFATGSGSLVAILDRNGNTTQLSYDASNRLVTVTDPASRHLNFAYPDASSRLVTSVTSDTGIALSYTYDSDGRMTSMTRADGARISFEYNSRSMITAVKDASGTILESHTYDDCARGTSSSRAGGIESLHVGYPNWGPCWDGRSIVGVQ